MIIKKRNQKLGEVRKDTEMSADNISVNKLDKDKIEVEEKKASYSPKEPEIDLFDIENVDFAQRNERRRGSRRRGYRRIDDRNLVSRAQEES